MNYKMIGSVFVIAACGAVGFKIAANHAREVKYLREMIRLLDYMECELQYHLTPLPDLCRQAAGETCGLMRDLMIRLCGQLEAQVSPDVSCCMDAALSGLRDMPSVTWKYLELFGKSLGRFDLEGQLHGLEALRTSCRRELESLNSNLAPRLRSYQTLGLCAGAALAILLV